MILRFFNVSGCIVKPLLGEFHNPETHLIPISVYSAIKKKKQIFLVTIMKLKTELVLEITYMLKTYVRQ